MFNFESHQWHDIFYRNIWKLTDRKLAEFKYKILCNILANRNLISKWNKDITNKCPICHEIQNIRHLLYECPRILNVWGVIGGILKLDITYKHIVIGNLEKNEFVDNRNLLISYIAYSIYKYWIQSENKIINFNRDCILSFIKTDIFSRTLYNRDKGFIKICDKIIQSL